MILESLQLKNFRNYEDIDITFSKGINILIGDNAQGKTNLLESIYVLALARSHRTSKDNEMIQFGKEASRISGSVKTERSRFPLEIILSKQGKKAKVNHLLQRSLSDYIGHLKVVLFAPEDLSLVKGAPSERRGFIDRELGQINAVYLYHITQYNRILKQRNQYLKDIRRHPSKRDEVYLEVLTEQLAIEASEVIKERVWFIENLEKWAQVIHEEITQEQETLHISYQTSVKEETYTDTEALFVSLMDHYRKNKERDEEQGNTFTGPHRDDISFYINEKDVQIYGSQGQQRTAALSTKLAEIDLIKETTGFYPVLLLDDVLSELDDHRQTHLLKATESKVQTFLTTTSIEGIETQVIDDLTLYKIKDGNIETENDQ